MNQSICSADVDEGAEVADRGDTPLADLALAQLVDQPLLHHVSPLLHRLALGEDERIPVPIDLDDLQWQRAAYQPRHVGLLAGLVAASDLRHLRSWNEAAHAIRFTRRPPLL